MPVKTQKYALQPRALSIRVTADTVVVSKNEFPADFLELMEHINKVIKLLGGYREKVWDYRERITSEDIKHLREELFRVEGVFVRVGNLLMEKLS